MIVQHLPLSWATRQAAGAVANGIPIERLFERAMISPRSGTEQDRISPLQLTLFQAVLVQETNDSTHMMLRRRLEPQTGPIGFRILFGSSNLEDGLRALIQFYEMTSCSVRFQLTTDGAHAFLAIRIDEDGWGSRLQEDTQLVYLYLGLSCFLQRPFPVSWVTTRDHEYFNLGTAHYVMGCPVRYGNCAGIAFPRALLAHPPPRSAIDEYFWQPLQSALIMMEPQKAEDYRTSGVNNHDLQVGNIAATLNIAPSTYRRRMANTGPGFRQYRERALLDAAISLLKNESWCVEAVAAELGYSDARSFRRFVKRTTGRTPSELREDLGSQTPPGRLYERLRETLTSLQG